MTKIILSVEEIRTLRTALIIFQSMCAKHVERQRADTILEKIDAAGTVLQLELNLEN